MKQLAILYWLAADTAQARVLFAQALPRDRAALAHAQGPILAGLWNSVGMDELGTGHTVEGLAAIAETGAIYAKTPDAVLAPDQMLYDAYAYAIAGRAALAVPPLARALTSPGIGAYYSPVLLWLDPFWDSIRHDPRFQALLQQYAKYKPAVTYDTTPAASAARSATTTH